ncbi:MAG: tetratricopeptide repeat protein [Planctomycetes bacterium]|nr:tetratricopeptide repeat protein [Planctomycetota bacterium]
MPLRQRNRRVSRSVAQTIERALCERPAERAAGLDDLTAALRTMSDAKPRIPRGLAFAGCVASLAAAAGMLAAAAFVPSPSPPSRPASAVDPADEQLRTLAAAAALFEAGDPAAAIKAYDEVLEQAPLHAEALYGRARAHLELGERHSELFEEHRHFRRHREAQAEWQAAQQRFERTDADFTTLAAETGDLHFVVARAYCLARLIRWDDACELFEQAARAGYRPDIAWNNAGYCHLNARRLPDAIRCLEEAVRENQDLACANFSLGQACFRLAKSQRQSHANGHRQLLRRARVALAQAANCGFATVDLWRLAGEVQVELALTAPPGEEDPQELLDGAIGFLERALDEGADPALVAQVAERHDRLDAVRELASEARLPPKPGPCPTLLINPLADGHGGRNEAAASTFVAN